MEHFKIFLRQLSQVRQLIGTKHFLSELLNTLRVPGAKEHWIQLFEDISLEDILDNFAFGGKSFIQDTTNTNPIPILDLISNDLLKVLKIPGDVRDWDKMLSRLREQELDDVVFDLVTLAKAPGNREQWEDIIFPIKKVLEYLSE